MLARLLVGLALACCAAYPDLLIRDVTVIDVLRGVTLPNRSVLIRGDRIAEVAIGITAPRRRTNHRWRRQIRYPRIMGHARPPHR